ncbi:unnamed protein product [Arctia plantaginis]|uniref:Uncharacterized protein n=1 Tax=Arctia plantaginis TaxID=874455 RepID=A0A8S1AD71_ARCPL|nr:unnamed protein product [Arctia plantaginis]
MKKLQTNASYDTMPMGSDIQSVECLIEISESGAETYIHPWVTKEKAGFLYLLKFDYSRFTSVGGIVLGFIFEKFCLLLPSEWERLYLPKIFWRRYEAKVALAVASLGIAATLLPGDRTESHLFNILRSSDTAKVLRVGYFTTSYV